MKILKSIGLKVLSLLGGPLKWVAGFVIERIGTWVIGQIKAYFERKQREKEDKILKERYDAVLKDENATVDDRRKAADDFLNRKP